MGKEKSNNLKKLTGSKYSNEASPKLPLKVPNPPVALTDKEMEIWNRSVHLLVDMKIITAADYDLLHDYSVMRAMFEKIISKVKEDGLMIDWTSERGKTAQRVNPLLSEAMRLLPFIEKMRREMGFSPETRDKKKVVDALTKEDKLEEFLDGL